MDKLISEQAVIDAISEWLYDKTRKESIETVIKAIPSAEPKCESCELNRQRFMQTLDVAFELGKMSAEPYKGMTNGEVFETLFSNADIDYGKISVYVTISPFTNPVIFDKDWWNSLYELQKSEE